MGSSKTTSNIAVLPFYTIGEEIAHSILHGIGALAATAGLVLLAMKTSSILRTGILDKTAAILFAATMIGMFLVSTLYHAIQHRGAKRILRILDHSAIYIFIAGTYTPFCLTALRGAWGWSLFAVEWSLAILGITLYVLNFKFLKKIEVAVYILMGWVIVVGFVPLMRSVPAQSLVLLIVGGIVYSLGTIFYRKKNLRCTHIVWHAFVLMGTACHWFSIWFMISNK